MRLPLTEPLAEKTPPRFVFCETLLFRNTTERAER